jgi:hypothetical protein
MTIEKERRLGNRKQTDLTASIIGQNGVVADIRLLDISPTGARVQIPVELTMSKHFKLLLGRVKIEKVAELIWRNASQAGIRFLSAEEIDRLDAASINFGKARRNETREKTQINASVVSENGMVADLKLVDISSTGARLDIPSEVSLARTFKLTLGRTKIEKYAELIWRTSTEAGLRFLSDEETEEFLKTKPGTRIRKTPLSDLRKMAGIAEQDPSLADTQ